ncbi:MAG: type IV pilus secretin PilQ, partial [Myxococcales bacterium]|nr:type IV pilus secretin PilQ [Myxococcales bacterium]
SVLKQAQIANRQLQKIEAEHQSSLTRLQTVTATKKAADDTLAQRKRERQQTKEKLEALRTTLQAERSKVAQLKKERERLARRAKVREAEFEKLKRQIAQKRQHVDPNEIKKEAKLKLSLAALTTERAKIAASIANLKALMGKESERYRSIVLQRKSEDQRITKYEAKLAELRKLTRKVEIVSQKSKKVERRLADLRQRVSDQSKTAMRLSQQLVAKRQALRAITTQLGEQAKKLARLKKRGKRRLARAQERKLKELKLQEGMARVKLAVETKKLEELTLSMKMQRSRLDQLAHLYAARVAKLKGLDRTERQKIAKLEGLDSETQKRIERLDALAKLTKVKESELRTQHSELKELALRKQKLADELEALKKKRTAEIEKLKNVANTNTSVTQQLQRLKELEARLNTKKDEIKGLLAKLKTARDKKEPTFEMPTGEVKTRDDKPTVVKLDRTLLDTPQPIKPKPEARDGLAKIRDIKYADSKERTIVTIKSPHQLHYKLVRKGGLQVLLLSGAKIPRLLERALDTSRRPSPVKLLSSFQDRKQKKNVKIVAAMRRGSVLSRVKVTNDGIQWIFEHKKTVVAKNDDDKSPFTIGPGPDTKDEVRIPTRVGAVKLSDISTITIDPKKRRYSGKKVNLTVKDADIQHVLTFLAKEGRVNIIAGSDVRGSVTFHLEDVPWELAFEKILESKSLGYTREGNIITVRPLDKIAKERELKVKTITKQREIEPLKVRIVPVNYAKAEELQQRIKSIKSKRGTVEVDKRTNTLIISDLDDHISAMIQLIRKLDLQTPQVLVETRIVEANIDFNRNIGIQWGGNLLFSQTTGNPTGLRFPSTLGIAGAADDQQNATNGLFVNTPNFVVNMPAPIGAGSGGGLGLTFGSLGGAANLALRLTALEDKGFLKIISSPRITTLDQVAAKISQGVSIPISVVSAAGVSTVFHQAVLQLQVTPHVTQDGNIHLKIQVSKNEPDFGNVGARGDPTILTKQAETELLVKDGETSVIGGIYTRNISRQSKKVPFFADIPVLGWFFRSKSESDKRTEMLIFITPRIVNRGKSLLKP